MRKKRIILSAAGLTTALFCALLYTRFRAELSIDPNYQASPERAPAQEARPAPTRDARAEPPAIDRAPAQARLVEPAREDEIPRSQAIVYESKLPILQTLSSADSAPLGDGTHLRTRIVKARFKYPLVRIEERVSPEGQKLAEREMVADHVLVQLQEGASREDLEAALARQGRFTATIRKAVESPGVFLVAFDGTDPGLMEQVIKSLESERHVVAASEPDYIVHAN